MCQAWFDDSVNPDQLIDQILEAFHHPYYATGTSGIQAEMFEMMEKWITGLGDQEAQETLQALTKVCVCLLNIVTILADGIVI